MQFLAQNIINFVHVILTSNAKSKDNSNLYFCCCKNIIDINLKDVIIQTSNILKEVVKMATSKKKERANTLPKFDDAQAAILLESIEELKNLPDAAEGSVSSDDKFCEIIKNNFEIIYDALTAKGKTKSQLIEMWRTKGINASLFKFNKCFNALLVESGKAPIGKGKKAATAAVKNTPKQPTEPVKPETKQEMKQEVKPTDLKGGASKLFGDKGPNLNG